MSRKAYLGDLPDEQLALIKSLIPPAKPGGCPREVDTREIVNGALYPSYSDCAWRMLPHVLPPVGMVSPYYSPIVESSFGWQGHWRRLIKDYDSLPESRETMIYVWR